MLNGVDRLIMMKSDVMDVFEKIRVCTHYTKGGKTLDGFPFDLSDPEIRPEYEELPGWNAPLQDITEPEKIPDAFAEYIDYIEKAVRVPVDMVSVGPDRNQTLER